MRSLLAIAAVLLALPSTSFSQEITRGWSAGAAIGGGGTAMTIADSEGGSRTQDPGIGVAVHGGYFVLPRVALTGALTLSGYRRDGLPSLALVAGPGSIFSLSDAVQLEASAGYAMAGYRMPTLPSYFHHDSGVGVDVAATWLPLRLDRHGLGVTVRLTGAAVSGRTLASALLGLAWQYR